jgi:hypothetical protein
MHGTTRAHDDGQPAMSRTIAHLPFDGCRERVDELLDAHVDMGVI